MMLGIGKAARLHTAMAENQAIYMKRMGKTHGWVATAAWTGGLALLLTVLTGAIWTALLLANLATTRRFRGPLPQWL
jgi:putative copper export protein